MPPGEQGSRKIQLPYINRFETVWEYKAAFLSGRIDFISSIGAACPICDDIDCYRQITPYFRYAIDLIPQFQKEKIPIARYLCRKKRRTFSLLPIQLIPYFQYTLHAVVATLLFGFTCWQKGQRGFYGASLCVDPDSLVTAYLILCWLQIVLRGFRRAHPVLSRFYDLSGVQTCGESAAWKEVGGYFLAIGWKPGKPWIPPIFKLLHLYSGQTRQFLFGTASQQRLTNAY